MPWAARADTQGARLATTAARRRASMRRGGPMAGGAAPVAQRRAPMFGQSLTVPQKRPPRELDDRRDETRRVARSPLRLVSLPPCLPVRFRSHMPHDALPRRDAALSAWALTLAAGLRAAPANYFGVPPAGVDELSGRADAFAAALAATATPATRTRPATAGKNRARAALEIVARRVVRVLLAQGQVSDAERINLGIDPRGKRVRPAAVPDGPQPMTPGAPAARPHLILRHDGRVRVYDPSRVNRRGRPAGAWAALVFVKIGGDAPRSPDEARLAAVVTRGAAQLALPSDAVGQRVWVIARYVNLRGQMGPPGPAVGTMCCSVHHPAAAVA
jgi:hypothetical protein